MPTILEQQLRGAGLRVTGGRVAVLDALEEHPHSDADTVFRMLRPTQPGLSVQSVHNILGDLSSAGLLRRIEPAGHAARYERRTGDNHHHIVCTQCGAIADVDCVVGHAPCLVPSDTAGFAVAEAEIVFWGTCAQCTTTAA